MLKHVYASYAHQRMQQKVCGKINEAALIGGSLKFLPKIILI